METNDNEILEKNKQRISLLQIEAALIMACITATFQLVKSYNASSSLGYIIFISAGILTVLLLISMFVGSYLKIKNILKHKKQLP